MAELLDYDPLTGMQRWMHYDAQSDALTIEHRQDISGLVEHNKRLVIESDHRQQMKDDWIRYASVPPILIMKWKTDHGVDFFNKDHWPAVMKLINHPDYRDAVKTTTWHHDR